MSQFLTDLFPRETVPSYVGYGKTNTVGSGTLHPVGMSLENAMKACWRVRRWDAEVDTVYLLFQKAGWQQQGNGLGNNEHDMPCMTRLREFRQYDAQTTPGLSQYAEIECNFFSTVFTGGTLGEPAPPAPGFTDIELVTFRYDLWWPMLFFGFHLQQDLPTFALTQMSTWDDGSHLIAGTLTFMGYPVDLYRTATGFGTDFISATMRPSTLPNSHWSYAPTSGGAPVFDTTTGAQIGPNIVID